MYSIFADDLLIFSDVTPAEEVKVVEPKLTLADSAAGQLTMTLPPSNVGYSVIKRMTTDIIVKCDDEEIWRGRVLQDRYDFWNRRVLTCEGELAFLNDTIQPPHQYSSDNTTISTFLQSLLDIHNAKVDAKRRFQLGMVTVNDGDQQNDNDAIYRYTNYETTLSCINDKLVNRLKGHLRVRHQNGVRYLDYIDDSTLGTNSQIIRFGVNLADFTKSFDMSQLCTVIVPRGARLEESSIEGLEAYLTVESYQATSQHDANSIYVKSPDAIATFGWIESVVDWDQVTVVENLYNKAVKYLSDEQFDKMTLEIKALDLHYLYGDTQRIRVLDKLRCISEPHGMDHIFPVSKMEIDLADPTNSLYTLGSEYTPTLTQATSRINNDIMNEIEKIPSKSEILKAAERNAYQMIMGQDGNSFVHLIPGKDANNKPTGIRRIEVTDGPTYDPVADDDDDPDTDPFPDSNNRWIWTVGGLGHIARSSGGTWDGWNKQTGQFDDPTLNVAMTMDGSIVANRITTGSLIASIIKTGILSDNSGTFSLNMENGTLLMNDGTFKGTLESGTVKGGTISGAHITSNLGNKYLDIQGGEIQVIGKNGGTAGYLRCFEGSKNGSFYEYEFGISSHYSHAAWNGGGTYLQTSSHNIIEAADSYSDERLKIDIETANDEIIKELILNADIKQFKRTYDVSKLRFGVIAQDVRKQLDKLGIDKTRIKLTNEDEEGYFEIDYKEYIPMLMRMIQIQQEEIDKLKGERNG